MNKEAELPKFLKKMVKSVAKTKIAVKLHPKPKEPEPPKKELSFEAQLQLKREILRHRMKIPPAINHFTHLLDENTTQTALALCQKYRPETKTEKAARLLEAAQKADKQILESTPTPCIVEYGLNNITDLVENKKLAFVLIANDVEPLELVVWLPTLCRKMGVPYAIIQGKKRLGRVVGQKVAVAIGISEVRGEDSGELKALLSAINLNYTLRYEEERKKWGGGQIGKLVPKAEL